MNLLVKGWILVPGTPDYVSQCGRLVGIYVGTFGGYGCYRIFRAELPKAKRTLGRALAVGGLPDAHVLARIMSQTEGTDP